MRNCFRFVCVSIGMKLSLLQEVTNEEKLNCNGALQGCRLNSRKANYTCNAPPRLKTNPQGALFVNCHSATLICKDDIGTSVSGTRGGGGFTDLPELNSSQLLLWLVQFLTPDKLIGWRTSNWADFLNSRWPPAAVQMSVYLYCLEKKL